MPVLRVLTLGAELPAPFQVRDGLAVAKTEPCVLVLARAQVGQADFGMGQRVCAVCAPMESRRADPAEV